MESSSLIQLQRILIEMQSHNKGSLVYTVENLFKFLKNYLKKDDYVENAEGIVLLIHRCLAQNADILLANKNDEETEFTLDITEHLCELIAEHLNDEMKLLLVTQIIYQIINTMGHIKYNPYKLEPKILHRLYYVLHQYDNKTLRARIIACIDISLKFRDDFHGFIDHVWGDIKERTKQVSTFLNQTDVEVLTAFVDYLVQSTNCNIFNETIITSTIQNLLQSTESVQRKSAYFLLKKFIQLIFSQSNWVGKGPKNHWNMYVAILESLEEEQTHLILPHLMNIKNLYQSEALIPVEYIIILNKRLLQHKNLLVVRWSVEHFLSIYTCNDLNDDMLRLFLEATNNNNLFNYENYFLPTDKFGKFLTSNLTTLFKVFGDINWKSIPMYMWLEQILKSLTSTTKSRELISFDCLLKIASRVRVLTNYRIRQKVIQLKSSIFKNELHKMTLEQYMLYVETLYNTTDLFDADDILFQKNFNNYAEESKLLFSQRFYEIFRSYVFKPSDFIRFLKKIPKRNHEWLRFTAVSFLCQKPEYWSDLNELCNIDLKNLKPDNILTEFLKKLVWDINDKNQVIHARLLAFLCTIQHIKLNDKYTLNDADEISIIQYMSSYDLHIAISNLNLTNHAVVQEILNKLNNMKNQYSYIDLVRTLYGILRDNYHDSYIIYRKELYAIYPAGFFTPHDCVLQNHDTKVLFNGDFLTGDARIEEAFNLIHLNNEPNKILMTSIWLRDLSNYGNVDYLKFLLDCHREITEKKSRYFKNSTEHRAKFKIACGIHMILTNIRKEHKEKFLDEIWHILLNETNQLSVTLMHEYILGKHECRWDILRNYVEKIQNYTPSHHISVIIVAGYLWLRRTYIEMDELNAALDFWLPLTMGSNYQARLYSQLFLYRILQKWHTMFTSCGYIKILENLSRIFVDAKLNELTKDIRIRLINDEKKLEFDIITEIAYATDTPYDEFVSASHTTMSSQHFPNIKSHLQQKLNNNTKDLENNTDSSSVKGDEAALFVQRKIKPCYDIKMEAKLITFNDNVKPEMFVVASLIDKLPNLGGIARTCEVFGIEHLILDSKMHITKPDFKNLSMTAEESLNIIEVKSRDLLQFLMEKQTEGFCLIGAEQTTDSHKFNTFKFPKKCVLLLGHEKDGIPPSLLNILDSTVEIPQSGNVRSLNVHVTAALFMWEYIKQHHLIEP